MAKNLKINIKNTQIAQAIDLGGLKSKLKKPKTSDEASHGEKPLPPQEMKEALVESQKEEQPGETTRIRARSKSAFAEPSSSEAKAKTPAAPPLPSESTKRTTQKTNIFQEVLPENASAESQDIDSSKGTRKKTSEELRREIFGEELKETSGSPESKTKLEPPRQSIERHTEPLPTYKKPEIPKAPTVEQSPSPIVKSDEKNEPAPRSPTSQKIYTDYRKSDHSGEKLGPTGRHVKDLLPKRPSRPPTDDRSRSRGPTDTRRPHDPSSERRPSERSTTEASSKPEAENKFKSDVESVKKDRPIKAKEFRDFKPSRKTETQRSFDARDRQGLRVDEDRKGWRKKRAKQQFQQEDVTIRPTSIKIRIPVMIKDLAAEMKLKASQLVAKLFMQGVIVTLNDYLDDETTIQLLGQEFGCEITIDTAEEERLRVTDKTIQEEIKESLEDQLALRPPVVAFMGHVDHGKTSLIDYIRKSNRAAGEAGAITQHIGAFKCHTPVGDIAILDTPGHEAFSAMRARGADVTDIVVLVVAGDEGIQQQTLEAIQHAKAAKVSIVIAINKVDKPNFDAERVYRQLAENDLLPEAWGGQTITVNCSAVSGEGISSLLEMLAIQAEVLELKANPHSRARGSVLESEMHKGMGPVATVLVRNGSLHLGDALVFGQMWGRVRTMRDEFGQELEVSGPSTPVEITGLSGLPEAGEEFIAVKNEKEAREIAEGRMQGIRQTNLMVKRKLSVENLFQQASDTSKKILNIVLRADVQGSLEALKAALLKITSSKAELNIIFTGVGEVSESDVQLAAASKAVIVGFHTQIESHADSLVKELGVQVRLHDIIYHAIDDVKSLLAGLLDRIAIETERGKTLVKATFKSSQYGIIAGCQVLEGSIHRNHQIRVRRGDEILWKGSILSLKRVKEDVREVTKGLECGVVLNGFSGFEENDILESYEITYVTQEL